MVSAPSLVEKYPCIFQQDDAPCYKLVEARKYLHNQEQMGLLELLPWPAQSPDLNPIEKMWAEFDRRLAKRSVSNKEELWKILVQGWNELGKDLN